MQTTHQIDGALFISAEPISFKGRDGNEVTYTKVKLLDDQNNYFEATGAKDMDFSEIPPRSVGTVKVEIREENNKLKKRVLDFS
jgi:hypothetical protein